MRTFPSIVNNGDVQPHVLFPPLSALSFPVVLEANDFSLIVSVPLSQVKDLKCADMQHVLAFYLSVFLLHACLYRGFHANSSGLNQVLVQGQCAAETTYQFVGLTSLVPCVSMGVQRARDDVSSRNITCLSS